MAQFPTIEESLARIQELAQRGFAQQGSLEAAESICRVLQQKEPGDYRVWSWLGVLSILGGKLAEAEAAWRMAVQLEPNDSENWSNLGAALIGQQRDSEAESCFRRAIAINGLKAGNWNNLATALANQERLEETGAALQQAVAIDPQSAEIWGRLGTTEQQLGRLAEAQEAYERSISLAPPTNLELIVRYANVLSQRGQPKRAIEILQSILATSPAMAFGWTALGIACQLDGDAGQAEAAFRHAFQLAPSSPEARYGLAMVLLMQWRTTEARSLICDLLADQPTHADAVVALGLIEQSNSRHEQAIAAMRKAVTLSHNPKHHSTLLQCLQYPDGANAAGLLAEHREWEATYATQLRSAPPLGACRDKDQPLRIGFLSPDFTRHAVGFLVLPALECLDRRACSVVCYSDRVTEDEFTRRFQKTADEWRVVAGLSDDEIAELVRRDKIDVLFDLAGHFGNRLLLFARKPAPIQVTWLGYVGTTGLSAMDFILADRFHIPDDEQGWYAENVLRMPNAYACFAPPADAAAVSPLPAVTVGHVTFGCFNGPQKYSRSILDAWASILGKVPQSRLLLKYAWLGQPEEQALVREQFAQRGVDPERILVEGWAPPHELLAHYGRVDIALDTQPYSGGLTTCESLWMGVPVVTFPGKTFAGRHATSYLIHAGFPQFVAQDIGSYIELAVGWANRLEELASIRKQMRDQMQQSALCDATRFASDFLSTLLRVCESR